MSVWKDPKTGRWRYKFRYRGKIFERKGFQTKGKARDAQNEKRKETKRDQVQGSYISLEDIAVDYVKHCKAHMQKNTWRNKATVFNRLLQFLNEDPLVDALTKGEIQKYLNAQAAERGNTAANRDLREVNALFNWGIGEEILDIKNPARKIRDFPEDPYIPYVPPREDWAAVKLVATRDELDFLESIYHTLSRRIEPVRWTWQYDINFTQSWVRSFTRKRRGGQLESVIKPMTDTLKEILLTRWKRRDKESPMVFNFTEKQIRNMLPDLCKKAKVKPFGFHAIRHHVSSILLDSGKATLKDLQNLLGHKRMATTEIYAHTLRPGLRAAVGVLDEEKKLQSGDFSGDADKTEVNSDNG